MFTKPFLKDMVERAIKTIAQTMVAMLTAGATGLLTVDYVNLFSVAGLAGLVSILTSIGSSTIGSSNSASLVVETRGEK
jgi:hypothetical protein